MKTKTNKSTVTSETTEAIIISIPHDQLVLSPLNPRKHKREKEALLKLANSILEQGVLHNLTARKKGKKYEVVIGEGRYLAVKHLIDKRCLAKDYPMPVSVKELSDLDVLELATAENIHRADMHPLDEATVFSEMMNQGRDVESIAIKMGVSPRTVEQRLAIVTQLNFEVKQALGKDELTLAQAQQLTNSSFETQDFILEQIMQGYTWTPDRIKSFLSDQLMPVKYALFPLEQYKGELSNNLFDEEHERCFLDTEQAKRLQLEAIEEKRKQYAETWAWVEVGYSSDINPWQYEKAQTPDPKEHGVILRILSGTMQVEVYEGVIKRETTKSKPSPTKDTTKTPPPYTKRLLMDCKHLKTRALQTTLITQHRYCLILNIMGLMGCNEVKLDTDIPFPGNDLKTETLEQVFEPHVKALMKELGEGGVRPYPLEVRSYGTNQVNLYSYLKELADEDLQNLFNALTASTFGSWYDFDSQPEDTALAVAVANDLELDMTQYFTFTEEFLKGYRKTGLIKLLNELGFHQDFSSMTSKGLIAFILSVVKKQPYLPKVVQFFDKNEDKSTHEELKQAA
jgi:ParB family transcriptional regulator, chromosome partitioning protein